MENSVSRAPATDGRFPQIAGMVMEADLSKPPIEGSTENTFQDRPSRIKSLVVTTYAGAGAGAGAATATDGNNTTTNTPTSDGPSDGPTVVTDTVVSNYTAMGDLTRTFVMATNDFLLIGGDAYFSFTEASVVAETQLGEQRLIEGYIVDELDSVIDIPDPPPDPIRVKLLNEDSAL